MVSNDIKWRQLIFSQKMACLRIVGAHILLHNAGWGGRISVWAYPLSAHEGGPIVQRGKIAVGVLNLTGPLHLYDLVYKNGQVGLDAAASSPRVGTPTLGGTPMTMRGHWRVEVPFAPEKSQVVGYEVGTYQLVQVQLQRPSFEL